MKICIVYGGTSNERDISLESGTCISKALSELDNVNSFYFSGNYDKLYDNTKNSDIVFNALHGGEGEDGTIQKFFESRNIKYTGSNSESSKKAMDKNITKAVCIKNGILTPDWLHSQKYIKIFPFEIDLLRFYDKSIVVKPSDQGSSIGLSIIKNFQPDNENKKKELNESISKCYKVSKNILIEEYIEGRELTVSILDDKIFPVLEIIPSNKFYDYECKYTKGKSEYIVPAEIDKNIKLKIKEVAYNIFNILECRHYCRVDFRLSNDNKIYFLELNTLPGFTNTSLFPKSAKAANVSYYDLLSKIIDLAAK